MVTELGKIDAQFFEGKPDFRNFEKKINKKISRKIKSADGEGNETYVSQNLCR